MLAPRSTALLAVFASALFAVSAAARNPPAQIIFPIIGPAVYHDDFGEPRPGGTHQANDILAERHAPVVAVEAGKIVFLTTSAGARRMPSLYRRSRATYHDIHPNT